MELQFNYPPRGRKLYELLTAALALQAAPALTRAYIDNDLTQWIAIEKAIYDFCNWAGDD